MSEINYLKDEILSILGEDGDKVFESPKSLNNVALSKSLELEGYISTINSLSDETKESDDGITLQRIFLEAQSISEKFNQANVLFSQIEEMFSESRDFSLTEKELELVRETLLSKNNAAVDLILNSDKLFSTISKFFANNAAVQSGLFTEGAELSIEEIEASDPKAAYHAKKTAFDQVCASVFSRFPDQYDKGYHVEYINDKHPINDLMGPNKFGKKDFAIAFVNMRETNPLELPKFGELLDPIDGKSLKIKDLGQEKKIMKIPCQVAGKNVIIKVPVFKGLAIAERN